MTETTVLEGNEADWDAAHRERGDREVDFEPELVVRASRARRP